MKFRGVIPRAHFPRNFGGTFVTLVLRGRRCDRHPLIRSADASPSRHFTGDGFTSGHSQNPLDRGRIRWVNVGEPASYGSTCESDRSGSERACVSRIECRTRDFEGVGFVCDEIGLSHENGNEVASGDVVHEGKQLEPDAIAQERAILVRWILERSPAESTTDVDRVRTTNVEQRVANSTRRSSEATHSHQAVETSAAQHIDEDRLGPVVGSVSRAHVFGKNCVAGDPGPGFDVRSGFEFDAMRYEVGSDLVGGSGDGFGFEMGLGPQTVVDMNRNDVETCRGSKCE